MKRILIPVLVCLSIAGASELWLCYNLPSGGALRGVVGRAFYFINWPPFLILIIVGGILQKVAGLFPEKSKWGTFGFQASIFLYWLFVGLLIGVSKRFRWAIIVVVIAIHVVLGWFILKHLPREL